MSELVLLEPRPRSLVRVASALEGVHPLARVRTFTGLERRLRRRAVAGCILDVFDPDVPISPPVLRQIRRRHPAVAIVVYSDFTSREMELYHLGLMEVDGVLRAEERPSPWEIRGAVEEALGNALARVVVDAVSDKIPPLIRECLRWGIQHPDGPPRVGELTEALGVPYRTLLRECRAQRVPPPGLLLLWGRLLLAAHLLDRPGATVDRAAYRVGYSTGGALRKAFRRHLGCSATGLRKRGGFSWALERFRQVGLRREPRPRAPWARSRHGTWRVLPTPGL